jgi:Flp pilus assembly protein TadG
VNQWKVMRTMRDANGTGARSGGRRWRTSVTMRGESGQSLVELALIVPIFALLILGAAEFGQMVYAAIEISNAARAGVAFGSQTAATAAQTALIQQAAINDAPDIAGLNATAITFCSCSNTASTHIDCSSAQSTCAASGNHALTYVQVNTSATIAPLIHYPGISGGFTMYGQAIMRVE